MDPLGSLVNAITLVDYIHTTIVTLVEAEVGEKVLAAQIRVSAVTLSRFVTAFSKGLEAGLSSDECATLVDVCDLLRPDLEQMKTTIAKIHSKSSHTQKLLGRLAWLGYRKRAIESLAGQTRDWSTLFHQLIGSLPRETQDRLLGNGEVEHIGKGSRDRMRSLSALFSKLAASANPSSIETLQQEAEEVEILETAGNLRSARYKKESILFEYKSYGHGQDAQKIEYMKEQIGRLKNFLSLSDPMTTGILKSVSYIHQPEMYRFGVLFSIPRQYEFPISTTGTTALPHRPETLHSIISRGTPVPFNPEKKSFSPKCSLDSRFAVAHMIAKSVFCLHSYDWVHESLRSENILMLSEKMKPISSASSSYLGRPFIIGFDASRSTDGIFSIGQETVATERERFAQEIYSHPDRQGSQALGRIRYQMCHDKYSIGVILLKIGLWMPLEKDKSMREIRDKTSATPYEKVIAVRKALIRLAQEKLSITMGRSYTKVVLECLRTKSEDNYVLNDFMNDVVGSLWEMSTALS
ncbi:hypothetical protein IFR05_006249 [Cadophora sp. M221]|nr:hypothetical protein IFR05_006249 [Cadophora sp. M221]